MIPQFNVQEPSPLERAILRAIGDCTTYLHVVSDPWGHEIEWHDHAGRRVARIHSVAVSWATTDLEGFAALIVPQIHAYAQSVRIWEGRLRVCL